MRKIAIFLSLIIFYVGPLCATTSCVCTKKIETDSDRRSLLKEDPELHELAFKMRMNFPISNRELNVLASQIKMHLQKIYSGKSSRWDMYNVRDGDIFAAIEDNLERMWANCSLEEGLGAKAIFFAIIRKISDRCLTQKCLNEKFSYPFLPERALIRLTCEFHDLVIQHKVAQNANTLPFPLRSISFFLFRLPDPLESEDAIFQNAQKEIENLWKDLCENDYKKVRHPPLSYEFYNFSLFMGEVTFYLVTLSLLIKAFF